MSYQVLARKWRPRNFHQLVGQEHVSRALVNALDQGRLHHAYLFTGTRGVGKTTIARILAKCLNCEKGVTSNPCGECEACRAIDENRFVDLIEVDAASRTKVEDTRELLDNVQYAPTQGRFKVYLIDEVHMLSSHSFNALLKTLEEPPPHVKFLLATTDPQKLPITVLSRCLQFALKAMPPERVVEHLTHILDAEHVQHDEKALWLLGRAADGSMRDALSLTDQAIAFGQGRVDETDVRAMLGTLDHRYILSLAEAIALVDAARVLEQVATLAEQAPDFGAVLDELSALFHRLAIAQMVPDALDNGFGDREALIALASRFRPEDVQLYYQIAVTGRSEMVSSPDPRAALEMTLLRMLAFRPQGVPRPAEVSLPMRQREGGDAAGGSQSVSGSESDDPEPAQALSAAAHDHSSSQEEAPPPWNTESAGSELNTAQPQVEYNTQPETRPHSMSAEPSRETPGADSSSFSPASQQAAVDAYDVQSEPMGYHADDASNVYGQTAPDAGETMPEPSLSDDSGMSYGTPPAEVSSSDSDEEDDDEGYDEYEALEPSNDVNEAFSQALDESPLSDHEASVPSSESVSSEEESSNYVFPQDKALDHAAWLELFPHIKLGGITGNLIANCMVISDNGRQLALRLDPSQAAMNADIHVRRLESELNRLGAARSVTITPGNIDAGIETPHAMSKRLLEERRARAVEALQSDPHIQMFKEQFGARLLEESVESRE